MKSSEFIKSNPELVKKARQIKSKKDFITFAKENGIEFEDISLETAYDFLHSEEELSENSLEGIAGGKYKDIIGNTFTPVNDAEAASAMKEGKTVIYLNPGYYEVNKSIRKFNGGNYIVTQ